MKPSRIIKSAHRRARRAGFGGSLKEFAEVCITSDASHLLGVELPDFVIVERWQANKAAQRKPMARRGRCHVHFAAACESRRQHLYGAYRP